MPRTLPILSTAPAVGCDCNSCPWYADNPAAIAPLCSGSNSDCSYCGCARAEAAATTGTACGSCSIRCGSRTDIDAWMADVGHTLTFDGLTLYGVQLPSLPRFVPQVDQTDLDELDRSLQWPAYAVGLRRVFSPRSHTILPGWANGTAHDILGLDSARATVLVGYGEDPLVEAFWTRRHQLIGELARMRFDLVLTPNFSMYGNQPRTEHLLNFRRNLLLATEMCAAGIAAVPNIYWFRLEDLERYAAWADDIRPHAVAINLQTFRTDADWQRMALPGVSWLAAALPATTRLIATGASRIDRITTLRELYGDRLLLIGQNALAFARHGAVMTSGGRRDVHARVPDAFAANVRFYASLLEERTDGS